MVFCNKATYDIPDDAENVTILILIDGFLQYFSGSEDEIEKLKSQSLF